LPGAPNKRKQLGLQPRYKGALIRRPFLFGSFEELSSSDAAARFDRPAQPLSGTVSVEIGLTAAIVSVDGDNPRILVVKPGEGVSGARIALPFGLFSPLEHRTLEMGLRAWVLDQTGLELGYVEQLYTFGDRGRHARPGDTGSQVVSIGYLALTRASAHSGLKQGDWQGWYNFFPWEDRRNEKPAVLTEGLLPRLAEWADRAEPSDAPVRPLSRCERLGISFGGQERWDEEKVLDRYELAYEAGLMPEALTDGRRAATRWEALPSFGVPMQFDHRRILATAMSRLRGKIKYRPVIFELPAPDRRLGAGRGNRRNPYRDRRASRQGLPLPKRGGAGAPVGRRQSTRGPRIGLLAHCEPNLNRQFKAKRICGEYKENF
jgi:hypothetical protein